MKPGWDVTWRAIVRYIVGALFVWAALSKVANLQEFYVSLRAYQLPLPNVFLQLAAITLPWLELFCGLLLFAGFWLRAAAGWALILCALFALCTGQAWLRGLNISCGCFNLQALGLTADAHPSLIAFLESVRFAFFRALILCAACWWLLRWFIHRNRLIDSQG
jgi:uncharacterized membrane protein YphA (DoxX/SURF4 family)